MPPKTKFRFSKKRLESIKAPETGRAEYRDESTPGLILRATANGVKTFCLVCRINGRPARITIGNYPRCTVDKAQRRTKEIQADIINGIDPRDARRKAKDEATLSALFDFWLDSHAKQRKRTWKEDERQFNTFLKSWKGRRLSTIKKADVQALHAKVGTANGRYAANRLLALLRAMFNRAADLGFTGTNPTAGIKKFPEDKRDRFLHGDELKAFFTSLAAEPNETLRDYFLFTLLTGVRKSNALAARWDEIDFATGLWRIPGQSAKAGVAIVVPLVGPVIRLLQKRLQAANGSPWVFASNRGTAGHIVEPKSAWKRIIERAGLADVRPHDLRRSLGSWMAMTQASLPVIGKMLGHSQPSTTMIYARLAVDPVRAAAEKATTAMLQAGGMLTLDVETKGGNDEK